MFRYCYDMILNPTVDRLEEEYSRYNENGEIEKHQLESFNRQWLTIKHTVPYYKDLSLSRNLPDRFVSLEEMAKSLPVMTKAIIRDQGQRLMSSEKKPDYWRRTGGTTAEPVKIPSWKSEVTYTTSDFWLGRKWYGIKPSDRLFLIWGHSHLLGGGLRGWFNGKTRFVKDKLHGYYRYPAYDMSDKSMRLAAQKLLVFRPTYIIGYSVALDHFVRVNEDLAPSFRRLKLHAAIGTAESFPRQDSKQKISKVLGCPVAMEYGAAELGVIGHTHPNGGYRFFWKNFIVETVPTSRDRIKSIRITSLYPRCCPLIRYEIGDEIIVTEEDEKQRFVCYAEDILGRCNDYVKLDNGEFIHSEAFTHAIKYDESILAYQIVQENFTLTLRYISQHPLSKNAEELLRLRLKKISNPLYSINICHVKHLTKSIAGKTPMIVRCSS